MFSTLIKKIFGSRNDRTIRELGQIVATIQALEPQMQALSDEALAGKTQEFKARFQAGETLDQLLPEAFAVVREVSVRTLNMRHFDVQLIGGIVLHQGNIAEMRTGEGKTLTSALPVYLNALTGEGVHLVTVNDYLAKRDSEWNGPIFRFLGMSVGVIFPDMPHAEKQAAYRCDIVYGTNNEFGFDYLRDNMAFSPLDKVQRALHYALVDEVDSILIDEARTPLIISGAAEDSSAAYVKVNTLIPSLVLQKDDETPGDYTLDEKHRQAHLTEQGHERIEQMLEEVGLLAKGDSLYHSSNIMLMHHVNAGLKAHALFHRDVDYIVKDGQIVIVDEHTGRMMQGRRWSDGLHQAVEAKEKVAIQNENQTLASITFQNYFRLYDKLAGMTGTADTEAYEFQQIYNLEVVVIPTNQLMQRKDELDTIYLTQDDKFHAVIQDILDCSKRNQPVLVGTASIEASEHLSALLKKENIFHAVLNAKFHEQEAQIIAQAGRPGAVTIATNMAGRGTDIVLGGSLEADLKQLPEDASEAEKEQIKLDWQAKHDLVVSVGGLRVIGSERHESRRIDNQLRGRSGRQGDPGSSRFYLSLDDHLLRLFASDRMVAMLRKLGMQPGEPIEHKLVHRAIENAQRKLEGYHFDVRKQLLDYDNVANQQRLVIYAQRHAVMEAENTEPMMMSMLTSVMNELVERTMPAQSLEEYWDIPALTTTLQTDFGLVADVQAWINADSHLQGEQVREKLMVLVLEKYRNKEALVGRAVMNQFEHTIILQTMDLQWREHLATMDYLRQGIHLRGYAQKDPKQEYKREAFALFSQLLEEVQYEVVRLVLTVELQSEADAQAAEEARRLSQVARLNLLHSEQDINDAMPDDGNRAIRRIEKKVGRNEICPCGSGQKYKNCHGSLV
ncbi:MAG: preprotein translocase subunit SecA [Gammaproteobacteria bacterium]|nr:preprotein translocase subunit SecA [Gammaproteobacteria bacterium]